MRIYNFVKEHIIPFNAVIAMSITVAVVLDFLAPQAPYLAWLSYALAGLVLLAMVLEVRALRSEPTGNVWYVRLLGWLREPPGPLWKSPGWQVFGIIALIALALGQISKARADSGGLIAGATPNLRNVQILLLGLQESTRNIQTTLDGMQPKVDAIQSSISAMATAVRDPLTYLSEGDYPKLQEYAASGKLLPQNPGLLMMGLNQKRPDRFRLLKLYMDHGFDIHEPMRLPFSQLINDPPTRKNLRKLDTWAEKKYEIDLSATQLSPWCKPMDLLVYATIADDKELFDWLVRQGLNPQEQYTCDALGHHWTMTSQSIQAILAQ